MDKSQEGNRAREAADQCKPRVEVERDGQARGGESDEGLARESPSTSYLLELVDGA